MSILDLANEILLHIFSCHDVLRPLNLLHHASICRALSDLALACLYQSIDCDLNLPRTKSSRTPKAGFSYIFSNSASWKRFLGSICKSTVVRKWNFRSTTKNISISWKIAFTTFLGYQDSHSRVSSYLNSRAAQYDWDGKSGYHSDSKGSSPTSWSNTVKALV